MLFTGTAMEQARVFEDCQNPAPRISGSGNRKRRRNRYGDADNVRRVLLPAEKLSQRRKKVALFSLSRGRQDADRFAVSALSRPLARAALANGFREYSAALRSADVVVIA